MTCPECKSEIPDNSDGCPVCAELEAIECSDSNRRIKRYSLVNPILAIITVFLGAMRLKGFQLYLPGGILYSGILTLISRTLYSFIIPAAFIVFAAVLIRFQNKKLCIILPAVHTTYSLLILIQSAISITVIISYKEFPLLLTYTAYFVITLAESALFISMIFIIKKTQTLRPYKILCILAVIVAVLVKLTSVSFSAGVEFGMYDAEITNNLYHLIPPIMLYRHFRLEEMKKSI